MTASLAKCAIGVAVLLVSMPGALGAQEGSLASMDSGSLRGELDRRYEAALAATLDPAIVNADDARYLWASEAKVQCAIAIGYLKSATRDETSIGKCATAYDYMMRPPMPMVVAPPPPPPAPQMRTCPDGTMRPVTQPCPVPPPPVIAPMGERG